MSQRANPTLIGLFVVGAIVLAIAGVAALGSGDFFEQRTTFISYFDESVNGLDVGAPVKFKGVPIGEVTDVRLRVDLENETFQIPVQYAINLDPVTDTTGSPLKVQWTIFHPKADTVLARGQTQKRTEEWPVGDYAALASRLGRSLDTLAADVGTRLNALGRQQVAD